MFRRSIAAAALFAASPAYAQTDWSGFYAGLDAGYSGGKLHVAGTDNVLQLTNINPPGPQPLTVVPATSVSYLGSDHQADLIYGGVAGFTLQSGDWLFGLEADAHGPRDAGAFSTTAPLPATALSPAGTISISREARVRWDWSARGRIGYAFGSTMVYGAGGVASARLKLRGEDVFQTPAGNAPASPGNPPFAAPAIGPVAIAVTERSTLTGWTAGLGGEHGLTPHFSVGLDARYTDYGSHDVALAPQCSGGILGTSPNAIVQGQCSNATISGAGTVTFPAGTSPATISATGTDAYPGALPGSTRISLSEWRVTARLIFRF